MYPVGPVSGASLFQIHAEKLLALSRRYGKPVPFLVMTSPATDAETRDVLRGTSLLRPRRGSRAVLSARDDAGGLRAARGRLLLEAPGKLFLSPNGHGGTLTALAECGDAQNDFRPAACGTSTTSRSIIRS